MTRTNWENKLKEIGFIFNEEDWCSHLKIGFDISSNNPYHIDFYKSRYFLLDYTRIHNERLLYFKSIRMNPYNVNSVMKKYKISQKEAEIKINNLKTSTSGNLKRFVKKYGEETGNIKYNNFKKNCATSLEKMIEKYGEEIGNMKWDNFMNTRDSSSLEYFQSKYIGDKKDLLENYSKYCKSFGPSLEKMIEKYGEEIGNMKWDNFMNTRDSSSLEYFQSKYSDEEALNRYSILCKKISYGQSLDYYIEKYGEDIGLSKFKIKRHNMIKGFKSKKVSSASNELFKHIQAKIKRKLQFGSAEFRLWHNNRYFYYDCFDEKSQTVIEFNGSLWHPSPLLTEIEKKDWKKGFHVNAASYDEAKKFDEIKNNVVINAGLKLLIIWDYEIRGKTQRNMKIKEISEILNEN